MLLTFTTAWREKYDTCTEYIIVLRASTFFCQGWYGNCVLVSLCHCIIVSLCHFEIVLFYHPCYICYRYILLARPPSRGKIGSSMYVLYMEGKKSRND